MQLFAYQVNGDFTLRSINSVSDTLKKKNGKELQISFTIRLQVLQSMLFFFSNIKHNKQ